MLNLNSTVDLDFKTFLRWWWRELSFLVPEKIQQIVSDRRGFIIITPQGSQLTLNYSLDGSVLEPLAKIDRNESGYAEVKALLDKNEQLAKASAILRLTDKDAIYKELSFPLAAKENINQVVTYELDRYTPFKADQVYFSVKILDGANEPGQIRVMLVLTTRELLDSLFEDLKAMEMPPLLADFEDVPNQLDQGRNTYNLLPDRLQQKPAKTPQMIYGALITLVLLLLTTALTLPVYLESKAVEALSEKVSTIEKDAKKIKALQSEVDAVINETQKLIDEKKATPPVIEILNTLSKIIKDDTSLAYLQYSDRHLQIQGESPAASTLIAILEDSDLFTKARFVSPVTQNTVSKLERFQITVDVTKPGETSGNP